MKYDYSTVRNRFERMSMNMNEVVAGGAEAMGPFMPFFYGSGWAIGGG